MANPKKNTIDKSLQKIDESISNKYGSIVLYGLYSIHTHKIKIVVVRHQYNNESYAQLFIWNTKDYTWNIVNEINCTQMAVCELIENSNRMSAADWDRYLHQVIPYHTNVHELTSEQKNSFYIDRDTLYETALKILF